MQTQIQARVCVADETNEAEEKKRVIVFANKKFAVKFGSSEKSSTFATAKRKTGGRKRLQPRRRISDL